MATRDLILIKTITQQDIETLRYMVVNLWPQGTVTNASKTVTGSIKTVRLSYDTWDFTSEPPILWSWRPKAEDTSEKLMVVIQPGQMEFHLDDSQPRILRAVTALMNQLASSEELDASTI